HGLTQVQRHRAMGDVCAMLEFFTHALAHKGDALLEESIAALLQRPSIPSHLPLDTLNELPRGPGVYRFYGENDALLYVGKSINIAQRVASHFSGDHNSSRGVRMSESLRRVEYTETAGELGALLLELRQIKTLKPLFNRQSRAAKNLVSIELVPNDCGYLKARLVRQIEPYRLASYFWLFRSKRDAERALSDIAAKNDLCNLLLGLEPERDGPCFQRALGRCKGACEEVEDVTRYNLRMQIAFHQLRLRTWPWKGPVAIVESRDDQAQPDILVIYNWIHVTTVHDEQELYDLSLHGQSVTFDLDSYKLLVKALMGSADKAHALIELPAVGAPDVLMP
ncbi:MAG TPA: GIY-YIG nuclease family protein, partial [Gammaproteobacteria bacterium]|nr:GIY-YIG nuclease family protein [Gammaproteobacteria bacterium]